LLAGCSSDDDNPPPDATLTGISVSPATPDDLHVDVTKQFTATGDYSDGSTQDLTNTATWDSSDPAVATITTDGLARGVAVGTTNITASQSGVTSDAAALTVIDPELTGITISPAGPAEVFVGGTQQFSAEGDYSDGSTLDITNTVAWDSSSPAAATIDADGLATGLDIGTTNITASLSGIDSNMAVLDVVLPTLSSLQVTPVQVPIGLPVGLTEQFTATGIYTDDSAQDLSTSVTWDSSDVATADIDAEGLATGLAVGATDISASLSGIDSNVVALDVIAPTLEEITIAPAVVPDPLAIGRSIRFQAEGVFGNGQNYDITNYVTWDSSDQAVATIDDTGLARAENPGTTTISASTTTPAVTSNLVALTVQILAQDRLIIEPQNPKALPIDRQQRFAAILQFADGTLLNVTETATWESSDFTVATVVTGIQGGTVRGDGAGTATITAMDDATGLSNSFDIEVNDATLESVTVHPENPVDLPAGNRQPFIATGMFSDGETRVLGRRDTSWSVDDQSIAIVAARLANAQIAVVLGMSEGETSVVFRDYNARGEQTGNVGSSPLTVTGAILQDIELWPVDDQSQPEGTSLQFTATGIYGPGDNRDITDDVNWRSSDPAVAVFDIETRGLLYTLPGTTGNTTDATASMQNTDNPPELIESAPTAVAVNDATLEQLRLAPTGPTITIGETLQLYATGTFSNDQDLPVTERVTWSADDDFFATVSNTAGSKGQVTGVGVGTTTIRIVDPQSGVETNTNVTVRQE